MPREQHWIIAEPSPAAAELAASLKTSPLIAQILINRGVSDPAEAQQFLRPSLMHLHAPESLPNLRQAAARIAQAIAAGEKIVIYGDYDVDGITATAILWHAIRLLGGQVDYYIPHRIEEGYGMNPQAVAQICDSGARLIVSVDCGITAIDEARLIGDRGVDLIVTDHHEWRESSGIGDQVSGGGEENAPNGGIQQSAIQNPQSTIQNPLLPSCHTILHPRLPVGTPYPNPYLCGSGLAFKLAWALGQAVNGAMRVSETYRNFLVEATSLAALGTIADVVPLKGENRTLARFGLGLLKETKLTGLRALIASAGLTGRNLDSYDVGFLLAPRLNACGRMGHAQEAVEMLTQADETRAVQIATYLEERNRARQALERTIFEQALAQCEQLGYRQDDEDCRAIVLGAEGWHPGVIGIVASRIVGRFNRPTIMVALGNGHGQGSGRSIPGFHLARALQACREHLEAWGGHEMAAGLSLAGEHFDAFRRAFRDYARQAVSAEMLRPQLRIDCEAQVRQLTLPVVRDLERLGPFGQANPRPMLCCRNVELAGPPRRVGRTGDHLQLRVKQDGAPMKCIAFGAGAMFDTLKADARLDLAVEPVVNEFNGFTSVELEVKAMRPASA